MAIDLEDMVPEDEKASARAFVKQVFGREVIKPVVRFGWCG